MQGVKQSVCMSVVVVVVVIVHTKITLAHIVNRPSGQIGGDDSVKLIEWSTYSRGRSSSAYICNLRSGHG